MAGKCTDVCCRCRDLICAGMPSSQLPLALQATSWHSCPCLLPWFPPHPPHGMQAGAHQLGSTHRVLGEDGCMQGPAQQARTSSRFRHWSGHTVELAVAALSSSVRHLEKRGCSGGAAGKGLAERGSHLHCMGRGGQAPPRDSSPQPQAWRRHWGGVKRAATCLSLLEVERALLRCDGAAGGGARRVVVCEGHAGGCGGRGYDGAASSDRRTSEWRPAARCRVPAHRQALPAMLPGWGTRERAARAPLPRPVELGQPRVRTCLA